MINPPIMVTQPWLVQDVVDDVIVAADRVTRILRSQGFKGEAAELHLQVLRLHRVTGSQRLPKPEIVLAA